MAGITHTFVSEVADGGDATLVRPSNWNASHTVEQVITDNAVVTVDQADAADNDFAKFTAVGVEGRSYAEVLSDLGLPASPSGVEDKFVDIVHWNSLDGYNVSASTPPVAEAALLNLTTGATSGNTSYMVGKNAYQAFVATAGKVIVTEWIIQYLASVTASTLWFYLTNTYNHTPAMADTVHHWGFRIVDGLITATQAGGAETSESTGVTLSTGAQFKRLRAVHTVGTDIKYYVDGVLKNTITTNLPSDTGYYEYYAAKTTAAGAKTSYIGRFMITRTY